MSLSLRSRRLAISITTVSELSIFCSACLREDEGAAAQVLFNHGLNLPEIREEVRSLRGPREI
jgi:Clp amino terminal domain, pathogenicity island component